MWTPTFADLTASWMSAGYVVPSSKAPMRANMSINTPTYSYAYKYAAFDGLRRLAGANRKAQAPPSQGALS
jgi:hypothetical protein